MVRNVLMRTQQLWALLRSNPTLSCCQLIPASAKWSRPRQGCEEERRFRLQASLDGNIYIVQDEFRLKYCMNRKRPEIWEKALVKWCWKMLNVIMQDVFEELAKRRQEGFESVRTRCDCMWLPWVITPFNWFQLLVLVVGARKLKLFEWQITFSSHLVEDTRMCRQVLLKMPGNEKSGAGWQWCERKAMGIEWALKPELTRWNRDSADKRTQGNTDSQWLDWLPDK